MTDADSRPAHPNLTIIQGKKIDAHKFVQLPAAEKLGHLRNVSTERRLELIVEDPDSKRLIRAFSPQEFYLMVKETGETDAGLLLGNGSTSQIQFCLDLELWDKWEFNIEQAIHWLEQLLSSGEDDLIAMLRRLDPELILLILMEEIEVGGGAGELATDSERLGDWDHTFDSIYYITFRKSEHSRLIGTLLDIMYRKDQPLYYSLMEDCHASLRLELEDICYQFRCGRLADLGFPEYDYAIEIFVPIMPDAYAPGEEKSSIAPSEVDAIMLPPPASDDTLLTRALTDGMTDAVQQELSALLNCAIIAERGTGPDEDAIRSVTQRVYGWLNIALEHLSGNDAAKATEIIRKEHLKRLFRLGCGIVEEVARASRTIKSDDYATGKALRGLIAKRPRFYRGLDPDHSDGYREFSSMGDIRLMREFLSLVKG